MPSSEAITYPIPISRLAHRYFVYNVDHVVHLRSAHHIAGVPVGTLPQAPNQSVFLGLPLQISAEEARLLVEKKVAYIVDEVKAHHNGLQGLSRRDRQAFMADLEEQGREEQILASKRAEAKKQQALRDLPEDKRARALASLEAKKNAQSAGVAAPSGVEEDGDPLFSTSSQVTDSVQPNKSTQTATQGVQTTPDKLHPSLKPHPITPTLSDPPIPRPPPPSLDTVRDSSDKSLPEVPSIASYALYKHLHSHDYFMTPGLRFGCQYSVYPGDPLRFHAHFLARGYGWDEEIDLLDLVGGGRLGTGVKKGYVIGGPVTGDDDDEVDGNGGNDLGDGKDDEEEVKVFCIEWGGM